MKTTALDGIFTLTGMMAFLSLTSLDDQNVFTDNISDVTWGDADYTLITYRFWQEFINHGNIPHLLELWPDANVFVNALKFHGVKWINLEEW